MGNNMDYMDTLDEKNYESVDTRKTLATLVGLVGALLTILMLFVPYAKADDEKKSLVGIAKTYLSTSAADWGSKDYATFYKIFVPGALVLIVLFSLIYVWKCLKRKPFGMVVSNIIVIVIYTVLKLDFADRRVVPGACDKSIAYNLIYLAFLVMIAGTLMMIVEKVKKK